MSDRVLSEARKRNMPRPDGMSIQQEPLLSPTEQLSGGGDTGGDVHLSA
eukprot:SAG31_NODE_29822_length_388_cov_0.986207_1_plen_48_part_01